MLPWSTWSSVWSSAISHRLSDVQEADVAGMPFDELLTRLDLVAHQIREGLLQAARGGLVDRDLLQGAGLGVHGRLAELLGVHLAESLEAGERDAVAGQLEDLSPQRGEVLDLRLLLAERDHEGRLAHLGDDLAIGIDQLLVGLRVEQRLGELV